MTDLSSYLTCWTPNKCVISIQCGEKVWKSDENHTIAAATQSHDGSMCSLCAVLIDEGELRSHYTSEWHIYNVRMDALGMNTISMKQYELLSDEQRSRTLMEYTEMDLTSGHDYSTDEDEVRLLGSPKINVCTKDTVNSHRNACFTLWRNVLLHSSQAQYRIDEECPAIFESLSTLEHVRAQPWAIILSQGGKFAGAVFQRGERVPLVHKTLQRYTVRRKQGGSQASKDNQSGTSAPKSSGSSLRRHNWTRLMEEVSALFESWEKVLSRCALIFVHAPSHNRQLIFGSGIIDSKDLRVRSVPFVVRGITFSDTQRVYTELHRVDVHSVKTVSQERSASPVPVVEASDTSHRQSSHQQEEEEEEGVAEGDEGEVIESSHARLCAAVRSGDVNLVADAAQDFILDIPHFCGTSALELACQLKNRELVELLLEREVEDIDIRTESSSMRTPLHCASSGGSSEIVRLLLERGADPTVRDSQNRTPYDCAASRVTREEFRMFAASHPHKWNYHSVSIIPATAQQLQEAFEKQRAKKAAKRRNQKKKKKQQQQQQKKEQEKHQQQQTENDDFVAPVQNAELTQEEEVRRKRLENLLLPKSAILGPSCGNPDCDKTLPKKPFEWMERKYCSVMCVQFHRLTLQRI